MRAAEREEVWFGSRIEKSASGRPVIVTGDYRVGMGAVEHWDSPEQRLENMDTMGIDVQVVSLNPILFRYYLDAETGNRAASAINDEIAEMVETWPDRFAGFATLPLQDPDLAVKELERATTSLGLVGAAIGTHVNGSNWDESHLFPILQAAEQLGALVFVHPAASRLKDALPRYHMRNFIANPTETTIAIGSLIFGGVLDRLPDLGLCFAHGGGYACWASSRFDHGYKVRPEAQQPTLFPSEYLMRMYFDSLVHGHQNLHHLVDLVGVSRVLLGTDYPADMGQPDPVGWLEASGLSPSQQNSILGQNADQLLSNRFPGVQSAVEE